VLPKGLDADIDLASWTLRRFAWLAREAGLDEAEMLRTFIAVSDGSRSWRSKSDAVIAAFKKAGRSGRPPSARWSRAAAPNPVRYRGELVSSTLPLTPHPSPAGRWGMALNDPRPIGERAAKA